MALQYHPDKNTSPDAAAHFQEIKDAYDFLYSRDNAHYVAEEDGSSPELNGISGSKRYFILFIKYIITRRETADIIQKIAEGCISRALELFALMDVSHMIYLHDALKKYEANIQYFFDKNILTRMAELIREKTAQSRIIILNPTIDNLLDCLMYKGDFTSNSVSGNGSTFLVPLWHHELTYEFHDPDRELIVKCIPDIPKGAGIEIDEDNNIHVSLDVTIDDVFDKEQIKFYIGEKVFSISCQQLQFYSRQTVSLKGCGIPRINHEDIFDVSVLGDIYVMVCISAAPPSMATMA